MLSSAAALLNGLFEQPAGVFPCVPHMRTIDCSCGPKMLFQYPAGLFPFGKSQTVERGDDHGRRHIEGFYIAAEGMVNRVVACLRTARASKPVTPAAWSSPARWQRPLPRVSSLKCALALLFL